MTLTPHHGGAVILLSLCVALILTIFPLPEILQAYRLQWVLLVLIYWCMAIPERVGVVVSFFCGIMLDILTGTLLGQHAMSLSLISFITLQFHKRLRVFPLWQQAMFVALLLMLDRLLMLVVDGFAGGQTKNISYWLAPLLGGLLWPWLYIILRDLRRRFNVC